MKNLFETALNCLKCSDPQEKIALSHAIVSDWRANNLGWSDYPDNIEILVIFPDKPVIVEVDKVKKRGFNSPQQIASLLHALAHIEITAVNLSWDAVIRFPKMPRSYYHDWIETADDEARHFLALNKLLKDYGYEYGDFPVHNELWSMAMQTSDSLMARMAIVHRVLESRALDVVPLTVKKFEKIGSLHMAGVLTDIANDEVKHVSAGSRWYRYCCESQQLDADEHFFVLIRDYMKNYPRGPFNEQARLKAGFSQAEIKMLNYHDRQWKKNYKNG